MELREKIAREMDKVLAASDRASGYAIADIVLDMPEIAAALAYHRLGERTGKAFATSPQ